MSVRTGLAMQPGARLQKGIEVIERGVLSKAVTKSI
jgi:hypothetical protein